MKFTTQDGEPLEGATPLDIVIALKDGGRFTVDQEPEEYMEDFAGRMTEYNESHVRYESPEVFVEDLVKVGYLTPAE